MVFHQYKDDGHHVLSCFTQVAGKAASPRIAVGGYGFARHNFIADENYSGLTKIRTRRQAADSTHVTARRANAVLVFIQCCHIGSPYVLLALSAACRLSHFKFNSLYFQVAFYAANRLPESFRLPLLFNNWWPASGNTGWMRDAWDVLRHWSAAGFPPRPRRSLRYRASIVLHNLCRAAG